MNRNRKRKRKRKRCTKRKGREISRGELRREQAGKLQNAKHQTQAQRTQRSSSGGGDIETPTPCALYDERAHMPRATCHMHMLCYMRQRQYMSNEQYYIADSRARAIGVSTGSHSRSESTHSPQVNVNMQVGVGVGFGFWLLFCAWRWAASGFRSSSIFSMFFSAIYTFLLSTFWLQL